MPKLEWNRPQDRTYEAGLDRGVIYVEDGAAVAWSGLVSVEDGGESTLKEYYIDGIKYLAMVSPRDWKGTLTAITYPDEFAALIGIAELGDGLYVDSQAPGRFHLSYRTMVSTPETDTKQHYKIHLIYKVMASLGGFTNETLTSDAASLDGFEFELAAVPIKIPGYRPSAHIILDTREIDDVSLAALESIIYGDGVTEPSMPTIDQLKDLLTYADGVTVVDNGDGTWTATGSNANIRVRESDGYFEIDHVNAVYESEDVYRFLDVLGGDRVNSLALDTDNVPYLTEVVGTTNVAIDTDGVPFFKLGVSIVFMNYDVDGVPYLRS
jgi:hypothetical protein